MKKKIKNVLSLLLMGTILISALAGCSSGGSSGSSPEAANKSSDSKKLTVAWWGNQARNEKTMAALHEYTKENPSVTFDGQVSEWSNYWDKLATMAAGGSLPDIIQMDYGYLNQYESNGLLLDLSPYIKDKTLDVSNVDKGILDSGSSNGKVYAICNGINAPSLLYNKTLLSKNGITVKDNMTTDEFLAMCRAIYKKTGYKTNIGYNAGSQVIEYLVRAQKKVLLQPGKFGVSKPEELQQYFNLYETGKKEGWLIDAGVFAERTIGSVEQDPLVYGSTPADRSWCYFSYSNQLVAAQKAAKDIDIGITTFPSDDPKVSDYLKPSQFFCVSASSKNPKEAVQVINYITNSEACNNILLGERGVPASSKIAKAISPKLDVTDQKIVSFINDVVTPNSTTINPPPPEGADEVAEKQKKLEEQICYGKMTAAQAAQKLFNDGNQILKTKAK